MSSRPEVESGHANRSCPLLDGASGPFLSVRSRTTIEYVGPERVTTGAGTFDAHHYRFPPSPGRPLHPSGTPLSEDIWVTHPDYTTGAAWGIDVAAMQDEPVKITLTLGGTVRGHVYDAQGRPAAGVKLSFQPSPDPYSLTSQAAGRHATTITDENGAYEVARLPHDLCYVVRERGSDMQGVLVSAVRLRSGLDATVDLGGTSELTGRLLINGEPARDGWLRFRKRCLSFAFENNDCV